MINPEIKNKIHFVSQKIQSINFILAKDLDNNLRNELNADLREYEKLLFDLLFVEHSEID